MPVVFFFLSFICFKSSIPRSYDKRSNKMSFSKREKNEMLSMNGDCWLLLESKNFAGDEKKHVSWKVWLKKVCAQMYAIVNWKRIRFEIQILCYFNVKIKQKLAVKCNLIQFKTLNKNSSLHKLWYFCESYSYWIDKKKWL